MEIKEEYIVCSAIHNPEELDLAGQELIYCGLRHGNILWQGKHVSRNPDHQGFLTSRNRFVNRKEAAEIALACGQIEELKYFADELDSSDLFKQPFWKYNEKKKNTDSTQV